MPKNNMQGQNPLPNEEIGALSLSNKINHVVGTAATVIAKPDATVETLYLFAEKGGWRFKLGNNADLTFTADATANTIAATAHGKITGDGPIQLSSTTTLPAGLAAATDYYVVKVDEDTMKLASSYANAIAGTVIDITNTGTGTHKIVADMPSLETPTSSVVDGNGSLYLKEGDSMPITAPKQLTAIGFVSSSVLTYYWL